MDTARPSRSDRLVDLGDTIGKTARPGCWFSNADDMEQEQDGEQDRMQSRIPSEAKSSKYSKSENRKITAQESAKSKNKLSTDTLVATKDNNIND